MQLLRLVKGAGIGLLAFALFLIVGMLLKTLENLESYSAFWSFIFTFLLLLLVDFQRKDKAFLKRAFSSKEVLLVLSLEYALLISPILLYQMLNGNYIEGVLVLATALVVALISNFLKPALSRNTKSSIAIIPLHLFELKFAVEKQKWLYLIVILLGALSVVHVAFFVLSVFSFSLLFIESFRFNESYEMIRWKRKFVRKKIFKNLRYVLMPFLVFGTLSLLTNYQHRIIVFYSFAYLIIVIAMTISYKYGHFNPLRPGENNSNILNLFVLISAIPGGVIISFPYMIYQYFKAEKNLIEIYARNKKAPVWF